MWRCTIFRELFRVWDLRARLVTGWGQAESSDGGTRVDIADDVAQATVYTMTIDTASGTIAETICTGRRYPRRRLMWRQWG